jgi:hypothetical protein
MALTNNFASRQIIAKITTGGTLGTMQCTFSQIGGQAQISVAGGSWDCQPAYALTNMVTFPAGTYVLNDVYEWRPGDANATRVSGSGAPVPTCRSLSVVGVTDLQWP